MYTELQQRLDSLRFCLYDRPLHPELFDIYDRVRIVKPAYEAQIWITGCTHVIGFFREGHALLEVTAAQDIPLPSRGLTLSMPFRGEKEHHRPGVDGIAYMMNFQTEAMSRHVYPPTHDELLRQADRSRGMLVRFPEWTDGSRTPFTYISYDARPNELHVLAFHAFPNARTLAKTQSIFELG